jgi:hypothetical protein
LEAPARRNNRASTEQGNAVPVGLAKPELETIMSRLILAAVSLFSLLAWAGHLGPASAQHLRNGYGPNDRFCLQGRSWGYPGNCQFATYEQCAATASGTDAGCNVNPAYAYAQQQRPRDWRHY